MMIRCFNLFICCCDLLICSLAAVIYRSNHRELKLVARVQLFLSLSDSGLKSWWQGRTLLTKIIDIYS
jgi:hypothetical protein